MTFPRIQKEDKFHEDVMRGGSYRECVGSEYGMNSFGKRACSIHKALSHGDVGGYGSRSTANIRLAHR